MDDGVGYQLAHQQHRHLDDGDAALTRLPKTCARGPICLTVHTDAHWVRIEVEDPGHRRPVLRAATLDAVDGRGLLVVDKLATDWGTEQRATHKVVWFEIAR